MINLAGSVLVPDVSGALFVPGERTLVVADLHLEKGSAYARRRVFLPPYDTAATLARLAAAIARYAPRFVVALGDSFHDRWGGERLGEADRGSLRALQSGRQWIWVAGNHDPEVPGDCGGDFVDELRLGSLLLRHEPSPTRPAAGGEIAGHLHPVAQVVGSSGSVRRRCFVSDRSRCIMPAFGAFTGGLNFRDHAFAPLLSAREIVAFVLGRDRVHAVPEHRCRPD